MIPICLDRRLGDPRDAHHHLKDIRSAASEEEKQTTTGQHHQQQQQQQQSVRKRVGGSSNHSTRKSQAVNLQHPWLVSTLKGHEGSVLDLSYSSNGKYLVSSSQGDGVVSGREIEEEIIIVSSSSSSSSSSSNSSSPVSSTSSSPYLGRSKKKAVTGLSRRQKKNRKSKMASNGSSAVGTAKTQIELDSLLQLTMYVQEQVLSPETMMKMGYPMLDPVVNHVKIYKEDLPFMKKAAIAEAAASALAASRSAVSAYATITSNQQKPTTADMSAAKTASVEAQKAAKASERAAAATTTVEAEEEANIAACSAAVAKSILDSLDNNKSLNVNAREYAPHTTDTSDGSSESGGENDSDDSGYSGIVKVKKCVRCSSKFRIDAENMDYLSTEKCVYHWGKLLKPWPEAPEHRYTCCNGVKGSEGCSNGRLHVWNGISEGENGPFYDFVTLREARTEEQRNNPGIFAIDCEMCYTTAGMELARVTVVDHTGKLLMDRYVKPKHDIICYNTRFSGITAEHMMPFGPAITLKRAIRELENHVCAESILVGHGLDGDLRSLRLVHDRCVDTAYLFPHSQGLPMRRALRHIVAAHLKRNIQTGSDGHSSFEDAKATMDLLVWYIKQNVADRF
ncbi:PREDICTED: uncharacterized protein DDB_G0271670-like isoform X2 [Nicrophorus vespilloides]|uniref:Uncharacterized protein DDB_G0271670-like isoform X2 n=1 Tax=Nicrophorus vespilloides TaxID=110193 RepID=A0ABM1NFG5_NICVS|nr:PREDICTED: uncharacterized protein DDB_G0271670-like isoform X2 [Nicrophorus vespilloides]